MECAARHEGDLLAQCLLQKHRPVDSLGKGHPHEEPTLGPVPARAPRRIQIPIERGQHRLTPLGVDPSRPLELGLEMPGLQVLVRRELDQPAGAQVDGLLGHDTAAR